MSLAEHLNTLEARRRRLRNPPNAVPDRPIEMRNGRPVIKPPVVKPIDEFHRRCVDAFNEMVEAEPTHDRAVATTRVIGRAFLVQNIIELVAEKYRTTSNDIMSQRRYKEVARARLICYWLTKELTAMTYPWIGKRFAGRDHSTIMHGISKIDRLRHEDAKLERDLIQFLSALRPIIQEGCNAEHITSRKRT